MLPSTLRDLNQPAGTLRLVAQAKTGDAGTGRYLQKLLKDWLAEDPSRTEAEFVQLSGLSKGTVNNIKNKAEGAGPTTVEKFAKALGKTKAQLYSAADRWARSGESSAVEREPGIDGPRYGDLPLWREAELEARQLYSHVPDVGFRLAASMHGEAIPQVVNARVVGELAEWAWRAAGFRERIEAETAEVKEKLESKRAAAKPLRKVRGT
jgi:hypothetical protein